MALADRDARNTAIELVKEALGAGIALPTNGWVTKPAEAGECLGTYIGTAVETLMKKLQEL
ncbi:hypothetical protein [Burkholderia ubonensis]|uniref:hypothetical protein n=1 Tax=Burkholderia ubonensis TaxID=101571 RepID=UPI0008FEA875|nr:hypothetical protein [Burkholderia ubonensis]OJB35374.1 hypothetical protein BGV48_00140 [Burkholderia ubonensis]